MPSAAIRPASLSRLRPVDTAEEPCRFFSSLLGNVDLPVTHYRKRVLMRRTAACLRTLEADNIDDALLKLKQQPHLAEAAVNSALLGVTEFFRDQPVFEELRFSILPQVLAQSSPLRVWSAACSDGHELYSVALLLAEEGRLAGSELVGTDCRAEAIRQARTGVFSADHVARLDQHWRKNFFTENLVSARIAPSITSQLRWNVADLFTRIESGPWHVILWRNMAIYLEPFAALPIWQRLVAELKPGGFLIIGKADHPPPGLGLERVSSCIFRKRPEHA